MSKPAKHSRKRSRRPARTAVDRSATTDVVTQLECAFRNPHAALIGALIGGLVPWFGRTLAHDQVPSAWSAGRTTLAGIMIAVVLGCALFSALSVYKFGKAAFGDARKALGFVLALEGVMLVSTGTTSAVALAVLILINAVANGSVIALAREATKRRCEADARRAATRARTRAARAPQLPVTVIPVEKHERSQPAVFSTPRPMTRPPAIPPHAIRTPARAKHEPSTALVPVWRRGRFDDVADAEIVSEELLLS